MSLRQDIFISELPKNDYNIEKSGLKAGYSQSYSESKLYNVVRHGKGWAARIEQLFNPESVKKDIIQHKKRLLKEKDHTNYSRMIELQSKILGMQVDKQEVKQESTLTIDQKNYILNRIKGLNPVSQELIKDKI
jgi:hypothetical protein